MQIMRSALIESATKQTGHQEKKKAKRVRSVFFFK